MKQGTKKFEKRIKNQRKILGKKKSNLNEVNFSSSVDLIPEGNVTTDDSNPSIDNILSILLKQFPDVFSDELGKKLMKVPPAKITLMGNEKDLLKTCKVEKLSQWCFVNQPLENQKQKKKPNTTYCDQTGFISSLKAA